MLVNLGPAAGPTGHTITPKLRGLLIKWPRSNWSFFGAMRGYRYPSNADAVARTNETQIFEIADAWQHLDNDALTDNTDYYYRLGLVDEFGNPGALSTVLTAKYRPVMDGDTDATAPLAPGIPALTTLTADIDDDGTIDTGLRATWTAPGSGVAAKAYELDIYRSSTIGGAYTFWRRFTTFALTYDFKASASKYYKALVRAKSFNLVTGADSALTTTGVAPLQYSTAVQAASGLAVASIPKGFSLTWAKCTDKNYKETIIFVGGVELTRVKGSSYPDMTVRTVSTSYTYTVQHVDTQGRVGTVSTGVAGTYAIVVDTDTDQSPPNVPSVVLASYTGDADSDGTIDVGLTVTVTAGAVDSTHPKAVSYICRLYKSATSGGTYVFHKRYPMPETVLEVEVAQKWFYKAEVRAVSFSGAMSALSVQPVGATGVQPAQYLGSIPTPAAPTVVPVANGMAISWPAAAYSTHKETILFVGGVEVWRGAGTKHTDTTIRTAGTSYTYTLQNVDKQGRVGTVSGGTAAVYRAIGNTDIGVGAVSPSQISIGDTSNIFRDPDCEDVVGWAASTGAVTREDNTLGASRYKMTAPANTLEVVLYPGKDTPVEASKPYYFSAYFGSDNAVSATFYLYAAWYSMDASGVTTWLSNTQIGTVTGTAAVKMSGVGVAPSNARRCQLYAIKQASASASKLMMTEPIIRAAVTSDIISAGFGANQIKNSDCSAGLANWAYEYSDSPASFTFTLRTDTYAPLPGAFQIYQNDGAVHEYGIGTVNAQGTPDYYSIEVNKWYELSAYYFGHRCEGLIGYVQWLTGAGVHISYSNIGLWAAQQNTNPLKNLGSYARAWGKMQAPATAGLARVFFRSKGTKQGIGATDSYLWIHKVLFSECPASQQEASPWVAAAITLISAKNTDQTALAAPASIPVLTQANQDIDGDGSTDIAISAAYTAVTNAVSHELEISTCATVGGTYVIREIVPATVSLAKVFDAKTTLYYKVQSRGIGFNGTPGGWSGLSTALKPVKPANTVPTVGTPTVVAFAGFNRITAPAVAISNLKKYNVYRYIGASSTPASATLIGAFAPGSFFDDAATTLVAGNVCWYYLTAVDSWDQESAAKSTGASVVYRIVETADVTPDAMVPSKIYPRDWSNLIRDPEIIEIGNYSVANAPTFTKSGNTGAYGPSAFVLTATRAGSPSDTYVWGSKDTPVEAGQAYHFGVCAGPTSAGSVVTYLAIEWYQTDASGNPTTLLSTTTVLLHSQPNVAFCNVEAIAVTNAQVARVGIKFVSTGTTTEFKIASLSVRRKMNVNDHAIDSISGNMLLELPQGYLGGFHLSSNVSDPTNDLDIGVGECASTVGGRIKLAAALTKRLDAAWAVGGGNGGLDTGTIANTTYHVYAIRNPTTGVVDALFSVEPVTPILPTGYTQFRRIGPVVRSGGVILPFFQKGNEFLLGTPVLDVDVNTQGTTAVSRPLTVPTGVQVNALMRVYGYNASAWQLLISALDIAAAAPSGTASPLADLADGAASGARATLNVRTDTSGQIRTTGTVAGTILRIATYGWIDTRGQD